MLEKLYYKLWNTRLKKINRISSLLLTSLVILTLLFISTMIYSGIYHPIPNWKGPFKYSAPLNTVILLGCVFYYMVVFYLVFAAPISEYHLNRLIRRMPLIKERLSIYPGFYYKYIETKQCEIKSIESIIYLFLLPLFGCWLFWG